MTDLEQSLAAAATAARPLADLTGPDRAALLDAAADALDAAAADLIPIAADETRLPLPRLTAELARTTFQLRLYGDEVRTGRHLAARDDPADPAWPTGPRPALRRVNVPLGPVVVFAASNFPFAFSVAGTDTAAALAAGCPVLLKTNPGHPRLSQRTADVLTAALDAAGAPHGSFALLHSEADGRAALLDPRVRAGAFTGSLRGGRALFDLAAGRPEPIPFYGELGSLNPTFVTRGAVARRGAAVWTGFADSFTLGGGQFCTKPGLLLVPAEAAAAAAITAHLTGRAATDLLTDRIADGHRGVRHELATHPAVRVLVDGASTGRAAAPTLLGTTLDAVLADPGRLLVECFGPTALLVTYTDDTALPAFARRLEGQLTATVHGEPDEPVAAALLRELTDRAGRIIWNGWPTGVSVTPAMHHGGPYPATTAPLHTSVGPAAITRFLRPVTFQDVPAALLPSPLRRRADPSGVAYATDRTDPPPTGPAHTPHRDTSITSAHTPPAEETAR
ncbi:aldehyde dehydrogenase (NADP(+)) [Dactylosporangium sp. NBC_01737]|uniref:aldehyde dehydrogenase (NADP(+)) n=1 Tax=Dactylosporangium sp. NBC_01737 TaxID=2975959 RepID=UPI002E102578|nr:aldehyde dehydrogenase (NADP(+)) [Dactylosporangium sp. NBC_01737]